MINELESALLELEEDNDISPCEGVCGKIHGFSLQSFFRGEVTLFLHTQLQDSSVLLAAYYMNV